MTIKKIVGKIHLWLGLVSGLIVFLSIFPASIFVWDTELTHWWYSDYIFVEPQDDKLPLSDLHQLAQAQFPERAVFRIGIENQSDKSYVFQTYKKAENPGLTFFTQIAYWDKIYVNPYSGEILGVVDMRYNWIYLCRIMHQQLLLNYEIGHWPVSIAALIMLSMLASGIILWWPRTKNGIKQSFTIKWKNTRWQRKNYDLHKEVGFYSTIFILFLATTGLAWSFDWWKNGIYRILGDNPKEVFQNEKHTIPIFEPTDTGNPLDHVLMNAALYKPDALLYFISIEKDKDDQLKEYSVRITYDGNSLWEESDYLFFHPNTGEIIHQVTHDDKSRGEKWRNSNYAIHVGRIWGYPTKVLACLVALICAFLPITGFCIWLGKRGKSTNNSKPTTKTPRSAFVNPEAQQHAVATSKIAGLK